MGVTKHRTHKHFQLDAVKIRRAQKALRTKTETETIERALDLAIAEHRKDRITEQATQRFFNSGIVIEDRYENLE